MRSVLIFSIVCAALSAPPRAGAAEPKVDQQLVDRLHAVVGPDFRIRATEHFAIAYDSPYEALRPLVGRLEGVHDGVRLFCTAMGLDVAMPQSRLPVIFYNDQGDFKRYEVEHGFVAGSTAGFYSPTTNLAAFSNTLTRDEFRQIQERMDLLQRQFQSSKKRAGAGVSASSRRRQLQSQLTMLHAQRGAIVDRYNRLVIQHEAAHQLFFNIGVHVRGAVNPVWLVEGLACQFEVPQPRIRDGVWRVNHLRLADLRDAFGVGPSDLKLTATQYDQAIESGRVVSLRDFFVEPASFNAAGEDAAFRYAQAWSLVFFLQKTQRESFAAYLASLARRRPREPVDSERELGDFEAAFGAIDQAMQREWPKYMLRLRLDLRAAGR